MATTRRGRAHDLVVAGRRTQALVVLSALTGALVGVFALAFEELGTRLYEVVREGPLAVQLGGPALGLLGSVLVLRLLAGDASPSTSDEYVTHATSPMPLQLGPVPGRLIAAFSTLALGGACGYEGAGIYGGAAIGAVVRRWSGNLLRDEDAKVLLAAGAAAGVAAVFKAPATGAIFAIEVPYRDDVAPGILLPALAGSAAGYLVVALSTGTTPLFDIAGDAPFDLRDLGGALLVGLLAGLVAKVFTATVLRAKHWSHDAHPALRVAVGGSLLAGCVLATRAMTDLPLSLGGGDEALRWALAPHRSAAVLAGVLLARCLATSAVFAGGGTGGVFIPLVVTGGLVGRLVDIPLHGPPALLPLVGAAAVLGAGYHVPIAAVVFVAESTGRPGFVVPALIAALLAEVTVGRTSMSATQRDRPAGHIEGRLDLPVGVVMDADAPSVPPDATIAELVQHHLVGRHERNVCVVDDDGRLLGIAGLLTVGRIAVERWPTARVVEIVEEGLPVARPGWTLRRAVADMEANRMLFIPVVDDDGLFAGVLRLRDVVELDAVLSETDRMQLGDGP